MNASQRFQHRLAELTTRGTRIVTVTVVACPGRAAGVTRVGAKMVVGEQGRLLGDLGDGELERRAIGYARAMLDSKLPPPRLVGWSPGEERPSANQTDTPGAAAAGPDAPHPDATQLFFEPQNASPWRVYLFGAGHVGQRLARALLLMDCEVTCVDARREWVEILPSSVGLERLCRAEPAQLAKRIEGDEYIVCATMDAETDRKIVHAVLDRGLDLPYVGVVGDREKRKEIAQALVADGVAKERALSVRCPIGLPLASREPGEVAIAIAAEMIQVRESLTGA